MQLTNKVAVITGAASGIGRASVSKCLKSGAQVVASDINLEALENLKAEFPDVIIVQGDISQRNDAEKVIGVAVESFGGLDILVNSAGITPRTVRPEADFEERWKTVLEVNVNGTMLMCHAAVEAMRKTGGGSIINLGSIMGLVGYATELPFSDGFNAYPVSKGAVIQFTRDLAVRLAVEHIRANVVCPGFIYTKLTENVTENPEIHETLQKLHPMGRLGEANEVANVIAFLASEEASFVTGAVWTVDGGYTAQ
jgi:NAD(P)-dependent dehydrogenase (short-subunit alcohol dehydrogenase family)